MYVCLERIVCFSFIFFLHTVNKVIFTVLPLYLFKVQFINEGISRPFNTNCDNLVKNNVAGTVYVHVCMYAIVSISYI